MAGRLNHPAIVTVYDAGEDQGLAYIAMEYLRGTHLSHFTDAARLLPPKNVMLLVARVAEALHYAHRQNVVHRDIKPANIMFNPDTDELKITDFGIARLTDTSRTKTGIVLGTPSFMSPEQLEGRTARRTLRPVRPRRQPVSVAVRPAAVPRRIDAAADAEDRHRAARLGAPGAPGAARVHRCRSSTARWRSRPTIATRHCGELASALRALRRPARTPRRPRSPNTSG